MEDDILIKVIESVANKKPHTLTNENFKLLKRGREELIARVETAEGIAEEFTKWYGTWKTHITFPQAAILQLNEIFGEKK